MPYFVLELSPLAPCFLIRLQTYFITIIAFTAQESTDLDTYNSGYEAPKTDLPSTPTGAAFPVSVSVFTSPQINRNQKRNPVTFFSFPCVASVPFKERKPYVSLFFRRRYSRPRLLLLSPFPIVVAIEPATGDLPCRCPIAIACEVVWIFTSCHIIPPLKGISSRNLTRSAFRRVRKQLGIFQLHLILTLPGEFCAASGFPSNFHNRDAALFQHLDLPIQDFHWFLHEVEFWVDLYFFQRNDEGFVG
ncbi:hypothetical protein LXL04_006760 [Taraxacum kok-saghyz]